MRDASSEDGGIGRDTFLITRTAHCARIESGVAGSESSDTFGSRENDDGVGLRVIIALLAARGWSVVWSTLTLILIATAHLIVVLSTLTLILIATAHLTALVADRHASRLGRLTRFIRILCAFAPCCDLDLVDRAPTHQHLCGIRRSRFVPINFYSKKRFHPSRCFLDFATPYVSGGHLKVFL